MGLIAHVDECDLMTSAEARVHNKQGRHMQSRRRLGNMLCLQSPTISFGLPAPMPEATLSEPQDVLHAVQHSCDWCALLQAAVVLATDPTHVRLGH